MIEICPEISVARGKIFHIVSKDSARKSCILPTRNSGKKTIATTMIPMPPNQFRSPRHNSRPRGKSSNPLITVDPVVVRPEVASKTASTIEDCVAPIKNGKAAKIGKITQTPVVRRNVFCSSSPWDFPFEQEIETKSPDSVVITPACANTRECGLPSAKSKIIGKSIIKPRKATMIPITYPMGRISNMTKPLAFNHTKVKLVYPRWIKDSKKRGSKEFDANVDPLVNTDTASWLCKLSWWLAATR